MQFQTPVPVGESVSAAATTTAPGSGAAFTGTIAAPTAGIYRITFGWCLTGTTETSLNNVRLKANNVNAVTTLPSITSAGWMSGVIERITLDGVNTVSLAAGSAATAGAVYSGLIVATRIG